MFSDKLPMLFGHGRQIKVHELTWDFLRDPYDEGEAPLKVHLLDLIDDDEGVHLKSKKKMIIIDNFSLKYFFMLALFRVASS